MGNDFNEPRNMRIHPFFRVPILTLAIILTASMAAASFHAGYSRGGDWKWIMAIISALASICLHIVPSIIEGDERKSMMTTITFVGLYSVVVFGHTHFFTIAETSAGDQRATVAVGVAPAVARGVAQHEIDALGRSASALAKRVTEETALLEQLTDRREIAKKRATIASIERELKIVSAQFEAAKNLSNEIKEEAARAKTDPVGQRLSDSLGIKFSTIMLCATIFTAAVLELSAVLLWRVGIDSSRFDFQQSSGVAEGPATPATPATELIDAVAEAKRRYPEVSQLRNGETILLYAWIREQMKNDGTDRLSLRYIRQYCPTTLRGAVTDSIQDFEEKGLLNCVKGRNGSNWIVAKEAGADDFKMVMQADGHYTRLKLVNSNQRNARG